MSFEKVELIYSIVFGLFVVGTLFIISIFAFPSFPFKFNENTTALTYEKCCGGSFCTDTYYDEETDRCVLTLCTNSLFTDKEDCYYNLK